MIRFHKFLKTPEERHKIKKSRQKCIIVSLTVYTDQSFVDSLSKKDHTSNYRRFVHRMSSNHQPYENKCFFISASIIISLNEFIGSICYRFNYQPKCSTLDRLPQGCSQMYLHGYAPSALKLCLLIVHLVFSEKFQNGKLLRHRKAL